MPTPPILDETLVEAYHLYNEMGANAAAAKLGVSANTIRDRRRRAIDKGLHLSDGARASMYAVSVNPSEIGGGWKHVYDSDGRKVEAVRWSVPKDETPIEDVIEALQGAFENIPRATPVPAPDRVMGDLLSFYPYFDVHFGMYAYGAETGGDDYDIKHAVTDLSKATENVMSWTPDSEKAIVLIGGDWFHGDDSTNQTPRSHHALDVDGRHYKVLKAGVAVVNDLIDRLLTKHQSIYIRVLRGNHDEHSSMALSLALGQRYMDEPRVEVEGMDRDIFMFEWGNSMIAAHHGDKSKPQQLAMALAEICPFWSSSRHRIVFTGHLHHEAAKEFPGIRWEGLRAFCPPDAYGARFAPRRAMQSITFHKTKGVVLRSFDPIERTP